MLPAGVEVETPPPPLVPRLTAQSEGPIELAQAMLPLVSEMQMTLSILQKLLGNPAHTEDEDLLLAQQVLHLASKSLQPLSHSMVTVAQQHINSRSPSSWQQEAANVMVTHTTPANTLKLGDVNGELEGSAPTSASPESTTTPTHSLTTSALQLQSGSRTSPVAMAIPTSRAVYTDQQQHSTGNSTASEDDTPHPPNHSALSQSSSLFEGHPVQEGHAVQGGDSHMYMNDPVAGCKPHNQITWPTVLGPLVVSLPLVCSHSSASLISCRHNTPTTDEMDIASMVEDLFPGHSSQAKPPPVGLSNSQEASKVIPLPPQSPTPKAGTLPPRGEPSPLSAPEDGPVPSPCVLPSTADSFSSPSWTPSAGRSSPVTDDLDLLSDDEYTDTLMAALELPVEMDGPLSTTRTSAPSAAVQIWAPLQVRDYSSYDLMASLPHVGVADRQEKLTARGLPLYWSMCVRCSPRCTATYHMVRLEDGLEMDRVAGRLCDARMDVISVCRVQNEVLWQRYRSEQVLMLQGAAKGYKLNEAWLYHTTSAPVEVICEEGLDPRLAHVGCFGSGTYFRWVASCRTAKARGPVWACTCS